MIKKSTAFFYFERFKKLLIFSLQKITIYVKNQHNLKTTCKIFITKLTFDYLVFQKVP